MHHVDRVVVEGFWDTYEVDLALFPQVTFLIGSNGTGKTTLINLIAAALTADFRNLDRIPFRKLTIYLSKLRKNEQPTITVIKSKKKDRPFELIEYRLKSGHKNEPEHRFALDEIEEQMMTRRYNTDPRIYRDMYRFMPSLLTEKLQDLVTVNWLSVHRTPIVEKAREEKSYESTVDQRLVSISNELVRFLSSLSKRKDDEVRRFQESLFVSLVEENYKGNIFDSSMLDDIDQTVMTLTKVFEELDVSSNVIDQKLSLFLKNGHRIKTEHSPTESKGYSVADVAYLVNLQRILAITTRWNELQKRLVDIFAPRDRWLEITNSLLQRKMLEINESNEIQFLSRSEKKLSSQSLSSGEKQLLILLSETLLQREQPAVFIADEPELSLHVLWQEKLVGSLQALNPRAQIIAATHSPDIVGPRSESIINMERVIP